MYTYTRSLHQVLLKEKIHVLYTCTYNVSLFDILPLVYQTSGPSLNHVPSPFLKLHPSHLPSYTHAASYTYGVQYYAQAHKADCPAEQHIVYDPDLSLHTCMGETWTNEMSLPSKKFACLDPCQLLVVTPGEIYK